MRRGEVWWVDFDPSIGGEIQKRRPAIIISNNTSNSILNRLQVVPITSNIAQLHLRVRKFITSVFGRSPDLRNREVKDLRTLSEAYVTLNGQMRKALANQITTVSTLRVGSQIGVISDADMQQVEQAIKIQLDLF